MGNETQISPPARLLQNLERLDAFRALQPGWNGYDADPLDPAVIQRAETLLKDERMLRYQPEIFPTARGSVQLEYEDSDGRYLEIEIFGDRIGVYGEVGDEPFVDEEDVDVDEVVAIIRQFNAK